MDLEATLYRAWCEIADAPQPEDPVAFGHALTRAFEVGRAAWPSVALEPADFCQFVAQGGKPNAPAQLDALVAADVYLAAGCVAGLDDALLGFTVQCRPHVEAVVARYVLDAGAVDDAVAILFEKLLVPVGGASPRLCGYQGRGRLSRWVRVAATRTAIDFVRSKGGRGTATTVDPSLVAGLDGAADPELIHLRERYAEAFRTAFERGVAALEPRDRRVLRERVVHGLGLVEMARLHDTSKSSIARWVDAARSRLVSGVRDQLASDLKLNPDELRSLMRVIASQVHVSVGRILRDEEQA